MAIWPRLVVEHAAAATTVCVRCVSVLGIADGWNNVVSEREVVACGVAGAAAACQLLFGRHRHVHLPQSNWLLFAETIFNIKNNSATFFQSLTITLLSIWTFPLP